MFRVSLLEIWMGGLLRLEGHLVVCLRPIYHSLGQLTKSLASKLGAPLWKTVPI
jgi:hypothetical protein